jgi:hypothetical protein
LFSSGEGLLVFARNLGYERESEIQLPTSIGSNSGAATA